MMTYSTATIFVSLLRTKHIIKYVSVPRMQQQFSSAAILCVSPFSQE